MNSQLIRVLLLAVLAISLLTLNIGVLPLIGVLFGIYLLANRHQLTFLKNKFYLALALLSVLWWILLIINQLSYTPVCTPTDEFCISGQTFWGDFTFGTFFAIASLVAVWMPTILIAWVLHERKVNKRNSKK